VCCEALLSLGLFSYVTLRRKVTLDGTVYDPKSGKTYSCTMDLQGPDKIKVRGFIGIELIGRDYIWTRLN
jgi:uncharacterized protein (DUF2147 family)